MRFGAIVVRMRSNQCYRLMFHESATAFLQGSFIWGASIPVLQMHEGAKRLRVEGRAISMFRSDTTQEAR